MRTIQIALFSAASMALVACVPQGKYDAAAKDALAAHADSARCATDLSAAQANLDRLTAQLKDATQRSADTDQALSAAQSSSHDLQAKLDGSTAENEALRKELTRLGKNADALLAEKGSLATALADAKARLEELRRAQAAAEERAALFRQLALKFHKMIDSGQLKVVLRNGRMVLQLANDVLFDSGRTDVKPSGKDALTQVAAILKTIGDRHFQVAGDTDNVPIQTAAFPSNWELSTRRAVEVVHFLVAQGMRPELLSAAGYGEFDPIAPNDAAEGRARNRRTEITLEPNINELVAIPPAP
jgi:chemotaxis protein MotB